MKMKDLSSISVVGMSENVFKANSFYTLFNFGHLCGKVNLISGQTNF